MSGAYKIFVAVLLLGFSMTAVPDSEASDVGTCSVGPDDLVGDEYLVFKVDAGPLKTHIKEGKTLTIRKDIDMGRYTLFYVDGSAFDFTGHKIKWIGQCIDKTFTIVGRIEVRAEASVCVHDLEITKKMKGKDTNPKTGKPWVKQVEIQSLTTHSENKPECQHHDNSESTEETARILHPGAAHGGTD